MTPGQSTKLAGFQHGGVLAGMILVSLATTVIGGPRLGSLRGWTVAGCLGSGLALVAIALGGAVGPDWPLRTFVFLLGLCNGAYAASAIGSMMGLASNGAGSREGTRMGLFGAAQGIAMGLGGFMGTVASDIARWLLGSAVAAYGTVFVLEAGLFVVAAVLASRIGSKARLAPASAGQVSGRLAAGRAG
jgi:BCD family chlorophyll transporter-like MFS transporter